MATAGVNRMMLWTDLEGRELMGRWRLGRLVRPEGRTAWFEAAEADGKPLMLSVTETLNDDDEMVTRLRRAAEIRHPNVVAVREAVATRIDDTHVVLAAMEPTEEDLADVLRERALSAVETQMVLEALAQGLAAIHGRGLVQGRMEPASVLATGETIKLRSDCLQIGDTGFAATAAEDVRGLGRIVTQALTRRIPSGANDPVLQLLPEPMARAVRRALSGGATVAEVAALAGVRIAPTREPARASTPEPGREPTAAPSPQPEAKTVAQTSPIPLAGRSNPASARTSAGWTAQADAGSASTKESVTPGMTSATPQAGMEPPAAQEKQAARVIAMKTAEPSSREALMPQTAREPEDSSSLPEDDEPRVKLRPSAPWVIAAAVVLVLATVLALYGLLHRRSAVQPVESRATPAGAASPERGTQPTAANRAAANSAVVTTPGWRVVAYTYNHEVQAEHKALTIAKRYPQLTPGVFAVHGRAPYLVTLGGVMSKADALAMRNEAVRMGLPRDTYAQNYR